MEAAATAGTLKLQTAVKHRYLQRIDVEVDTAYAGTDAEPLLVSSKDLSIAVASLQRNPWPGLRSWRACILQ